MGRRGWSRCEAKYDRSVSVIGDIGCDLCYGKGELSKVEKEFWELLVGRRKVVLAVSMDLRSFGGLLTPNR